MSSTPMIPWAPGGPPTATATGSQRFSRRRFLVGAGGLVGTAAVVGLGGAWLEDHLAAQGLPVHSTASASDGPVLVVLTLYGGNDGLNTVIPYGDPAYSSARGALAIDGSSVLALQDGFGLHPSLAQFHGLWQKGQLAVVHGVGYPQPNLSHFASMDIWQSASPDGSLPTGWLGRWLDGTGRDPLRALAIGPSVPLELSGAKVQGAAVPTPPLLVPGSPALQRAFATMGAATGSAVAGGPSLGGDVATSGDDLLLLVRELGPLFDGSAAAAAAGSTNLEGGAGGLAIAQGGGGRAGAGVLQDQLAMVATMVKAKVPTKVFAVSAGGFDTHAGQLATQKALLSELDAAVPAFVAGLADSERPVVVVVHTEFGRRVSANASGGTDHGAANVVLVAGRGVRGGFYGDPPSLTKLDDNGNLQFSTDFRSVYATVLDQVVGVDPSSVLAGRFPTVPFL